MCYWQGLFELMRNYEVSHLLGCEMRYCETHHEVNIMAPVTDESLMHMYVCYYVCIVGR